MRLLSMIGKTPVVICHSSQRHSTHIHTQTHFSYDVDNVLLIMVVLILHFSNYELFVIIFWLSIPNGKDILLTSPFCFCRWRC